MKEFTVVPMPHPGHQMCGMRSVRRNGSTGFTVSSLENFSIGLPPRWRSGFRQDCGLRRPREKRRTSSPWPSAARSTSRTIWPRFNSGTTNAFTFAASSAIFLLRERPGRNQTQLPDLQPAIAGRVNRPLRHARRDAVGNYHHVSAIQSLFFEQADACRRRCEFCSAGAVPVCPASAASCSDSHVRRASGR